MGVRAAAVAVVLAASAAVTGCAPATDPEVLAWNSCIATYLEHDDPEAECELVQAADDEFVEHWTDRDFVEAWQRYLRNDE